MGKILTQENVEIYFTREEIEAAVKKGKTWIVFDRKVYDVTKWIKYHPGGDLVISHQNGKDTTDWIKAMHPSWVVEKKLPHFFIGNLSVSGDKIPCNTNHAGDTSEEDLKNFGQDPLSKSYLELGKKLEEEGYYTTRLSYYLEKIFVLSILLALSWILVIFGTSTSWYMLSALVLAAFWHQLAFVGHDAGHNSITHDSFKDNMIGIFVGNFLGGISIGWWKHSHNVHHVVTNHPEHDPDIQHLPFFAVSTRFSQSLYSTYHKRIMQFDWFAKVMVSFQSYLYYFILFFGRFNLYFNSWNYLANPKVRYQKLEIIGMIFFWTWFSYLLSFLPNYSLQLAYILISHGFTFILHAQITLSHFSMSTEQFGDHEAFVKHQLRTTTDVDCPEWFDWFHGGLQYQVVHHLFPRIPRHNLRKARPLVRQFAQQHGLEYHCVTFSKGSGMVLDTLREVGNQIGILAKSMERKC